MEIDRRVRAKEFMELLSVKRKKFYELIKKGEISQPHRLTRKDVFWYASEVKAIVEKPKKESDTMACS